MKMDSLPWRALPEGPVGAREIYDANDRCVGWVHEPLNNADYVVRCVNGVPLLVNLLIESFENSTDSKWMDRIEEVLGTLEGFSDDSER